MADNEHLKQSFEAHVRPLYGFASPQASLNAIKAVAQRQLKKRLKGAGAQCQQPPVS